MKKAVIYCGVVMTSMSSLAIAEHLGNSDKVLETVVVTATREESLLSNTAASVGILSESLLSAVNPTHASEALNRIPGVNIVQLGSTGESTAAAIRQPVSYGPVYLYLENGVPTRSAGFFNHNALYEINVSGANGVEVIKGPGSALYGSDAIGAVINILSGQPPTEDRLSLGLEIGEDQWQRLQLRSAKVLGNQGFTARLDVSQYDGWRERTESERQSFTGSWNINVNDSLTLNTVFTASKLDYDTGGSGLLYDDYKDDPKQAGNLIGYREVEAFRLSTAIEKQLGANKLTITPFLRSNELEYIATWTLNSGREVTPRSWQCEPVVPGVPCTPVSDSQDAHINQSSHDSAGVLIKYHYALANNSFVISGIDIDYTKGEQVQTHIRRTDLDSGSYWLAYEKDPDKLYDYDADFFSFSPYIHWEQQVIDKLRLSMGLRYDNIRYDYKNNLSTDLIDPIHKRPADQVVEMDHLSPKLSAIYQLSEQINLFAAYRHAFRVPSAGQLFRAGKNEDSTSLEPVKADSFELGLRGNIGTRVAFDSSLYYMTKKDDIISITDETTGGRRNTNAGETEHYGVELGIDLLLSDEWDLYAAYSYSEHKFDEWKDRSGDFSGNDIPNAPQDFLNMRLNYRPAILKGGRIELEWVHQGKHWIDEKNADDNNASDRDSYDGHNLLHLRADYQLTQQVNVYARVLNLGDKRYAETTSKWGPKYTPGRQRSAFVGVKYDF